MKDNQKPKEHLIDYFDYFDIPEKDLIALKIYLERKYDFEKYSHQQIADAANSLYGDCWEYRVKDDFQKVFNGYFRDKIGFAKYWIEKNTDGELAKYVDFEKFAGDIFKRDYWCVETPLGLAVFKKEEYCDGR
mgnify:FL=1